MQDKFYLEMKKLNGIKIYKDINIKKETTLKIDTYFLYKIEIFSIFMVKKVFQLISKYNIKYYFLGNGSNTLFVREYYKGALIKLMPRASKSLNIVFAGNRLNVINDQYVSMGVSSLDFLSSVPCSIGGAIYMNAGAFNESISDIIEYVHIYDINEKRFKSLNKKECLFNYRDSYFRHHNVIILSAKIKLKYENVALLKKIHIERILIRKNKLPLEYPNLGSVFKNPDGYSAGKLIEDIGMKGFKLGGSMISEKHANVIVNFNNTKGKDMFDLINLIRDKVYIKYKIYLEPEIIIFK